MQFGGKYPWWDRDKIEVDCPDRTNTVSIRIEKKITLTFSEPVYSIPRHPGRLIVKPRPLGYVENKVHNPP